MAEDKMRKELDDQLPEYTFKEGSLNQVFSTHVWKTIEDLLDAQGAIVLAHLTDPEGGRDSDMYFKGLYSQIQYMKNIKLTLLEV